MVFDQEQAPKKRSKRKILIVFGATFTLVLYLWFFWFQTLMAISTRYSYRDIPIASVMPVALTDHNANASAGTKLSCFDYEFEVPWNDVDADNIQRKTMVLVPFHSGLDLLVGQGSTHQIVDTVIENSKSNRQQFQAVYGDAATRSDYEFLRLALNATPAKVSFLGSRQDVTRQSTLILVKTLIVPGDSGIFEVQANEFRGFQYGDPIKQPKKITVTLYSAENGIELTLSRKDGKPLAGISQADVNRIIQSVHHSALAAKSN